MYEIDCKKITKKAGVEVNIGANPSAEGEDHEDVEEEIEKVIDIVDGFRLNLIPFADKKAFASQLKGALVASTIALMLGVDKLDRLPKEGC